MQQKFVRGILKKLSHLNFSISNRIVTLFIMVAFTNNQLVDHSSNKSRDMASRKCNKALFNDNTISRYVNRNYGWNFPCVYILMRTQLCTLIHTFITCCILIPLCALVRISNCDYHTVYCMEKILTDRYPKHTWQRKHWRIEYLNKRLVDETAADWPAITKFTKVLLAKVFTVWYSYFKKKLGLKIEN